MLHQLAVVKALDDLKPPVEKDDITDHLTPWLNDLRLSQNAIDTILSLPPRNATLENARFECSSYIEEVTLCVIIFYHW